MGNNNSRSVRFLQSQKDFPLLVSLDKKLPSWGLSRWKEKDCLRFIPSDDEGFTLRGDKQQLLYKGRRRSHRFTIHSDNNFEYDCILLREPESNVISLLMQGAENFDFFKQPYFVDDPFLKGSIAVYRKQTLIGQGTGKLCHIYRPLIIDARGRKCWGTLSVIGNELRITIPEQWLSEAKYPVVVDPYVGSLIVGGSNMYNGSPMLLECTIPVNKFLVGNYKVNGACTAYFYTDRDDPEAGGFPVVYTHNYNQPHLKLSSQENYTNLRVTSSMPKGWRSANFYINDTIESETNIWFGLFTKYFWYPRYDYTGTYWEYYWENEDVIPEVYPGYRTQNSPFLSVNYKLSMYFEYTEILPQSYIRTVTQGVDLNDNRKYILNVKRNILTILNSIDIIKTPFIYLKKIFDTINLNDLFNQGKGYYRKQNDNIYADGNVFKNLHLIIKIISNCFTKIILKNKFLMAHEEITICSKINKEVWIESKIM